MRILGPIQRTWSELKAAKPGRRFREHYKRRNRSSGHGPIRKVVMIVAGAVLILAGIVLLVLPGPGIATIALGGALIATECYVAATALDVVELRARHAIRTLFHQVPRPLDDERN